MFISEILDLLFRRKIGNKAGSNATPLCPCSHASHKTHALALAFDCTRPGGDIDLAVGNHAPKEKECSILMEFE